jgi:hypothetical protein
MENINYKLNGKFEIEDDLGNKYNIRVVRNAQKSITYINRLTHAVETIKKQDIVVIRKLKEPQYDPQTLKPINQNSKGVGK